MDKLSFFMKFFLHGVLFLFIFSLNVNAQRICGSGDYKQQLLSTNPSYKQIFSSIETQIAAVTKRQNGNVAMRDTAANEIIYIPVVVHVLYKKADENISDAQIKSQIDVLNNDFAMLNSDGSNTPAAFKSFAANSKIKFCLAQVDPQGKRTSGIDRKYTSKDMFTTDDAMKMSDKGGVASWDSKHYLNIWVCRLSSRSLGYATPPGAAADKDGVVIAYDVFGTGNNLRASFNKGRTATHEVGHWLGLIHIWGDENCGSDQVDDTPTQQSYNFGCPTFPKLSACSPDKNGDMFMNFMDFSDDACMNMFTLGQVKRMRALFAQNNVRNSFLASFACDSTSAQAGPLPLAEVKAAPAISLTFAKIYPSPFLSTTTIECAAATDLTVKTLTIFNTVGMQVYSLQLSKAKTTLDLSNLTAGIYFVKIADEKSQFTSRIIKQ